MSKIIVGLSGGVDSAVAAYLLKSAGHDVIGVTLKTWSGENEQSRCCEIDDARRIAWKLDIPYYAVNCAAEFRRLVIEPFIDDYTKGKTPNPCVLCNRVLKWEQLLYAADSMMADYVATGHYASIVKHDNGLFSVKNAAYAEKDQTYMLYRLSQQQLKRTIMPLGGLAKSEVRAIAERAGLPVADKADSQEICFVTDGEYADYIEQNSENYIPCEGNFVDESGAVIGRHKGLIHYTVGQRRGLGLAMGRPVYVKRIDAEKNEVVISGEESLYTREIFCGSLNFQSIPDIAVGQQTAANVKIRYRHSSQPAVITKCGSDMVRVLFDSPVRAATPGQSAVFYDDNGCVIGGGIIE